MGLLSRVAPQWALKRAVAKHRLERISKLDVKRTQYNSTTHNRNNFDFRSPLTSADSAVNLARDVWRKKVRHLEYEEPFVAGPIKRIANNVVGQGFVLRSKAGTPELIKQVEQMFKDWSLLADIRRILTFSDLMKITQMAMDRDGEVLVVGRESKYEHRVTPYCLEVLEIDRLQTPHKYATDEKVKEGIRYDDDDAPIEYYVLKSHPGAVILPGMISDMSAFDVIKADYGNGDKRVFHLFNPTRPEQSRGYSQFASSLEDFEQLDKYTNAEIYASIEDACLTGFVKVDNPDTWQQNATETNPGNPDERLHEFGYNQIMYLNPNEDITIHKPSRPNTQLGEMVNQLLRGPANALDIPPEVLAQNFQGMNYSNARTVLLQFQHTMRIKQRYLIDHLCTPVFRHLINSALVVGMIRAVDIEEATKHGWIPPGWQWVDPLKEAKGKTEEINSRFTSISKVIASRGDDPDEVFDEIERDNERIRNFGTIENTDGDIGGIQNADPEDVVDPGTALNGAQVAAMLAIVTQVAEGALDKSTASKVIAASFPMSIDEAEEMLKDVEVVGPDKNADAPELEPTEDDNEGDDDES